MAETDWEKPPYDMLITADRFQDNGVGAKFALDVREQNPNLPIIISTANHISSLNISEEALNRRNIAYVRKDVGFQKNIVKQVEQDLGTGQGNSIHS